MQRRELDNPWVPETWEAVEARIEDDSQASDVSPLDEDDSGSRWLWRGYEIVLQPGEAEGYLLNMQAPDPRLFVCWRPEGDVAKPAMVTVSYGEAARWVDASENVDGVPIPAEMAPVVRQFAELHYRREPKRKRR